MSIASRIKEINSSLTGECRLVAVSKFQPIPLLKEAYDCGQRIFGESKVQELTEKESVLPKDIEWHFIGHLQTNKVKYIVPFISLIHSVDSLKLAIEIDRQAKKNNRVINCLLEVHIAKEESKQGFTPDEVKQLFLSNAFLDLKNINIIGLMGMATYTENNNLIRSEFKTLSALFNDLKQSLAPQFSELSIGMSNDYKIAKEEGSTLVRIGTYIFGERDYGI
jgi:pyridoxal phosphate enzyme (YggS family)